MSKHISRRNLAADLSILNIKNFDIPMQDTQTKLHETFDFKLPKSKESFFFQILSQVGRIFLNHHERWRLSLPS